MNAQVRHHWPAIVAASAALFWGIAAAQGSVANGAGPGSKSAPSSVTAAAPHVDDIRDIRGPKPLPTWWLLWVSTAGTALFAAGLYVVWRRNRRGAGRAGAAPAGVALLRLQGSRSLIAAGECRRFSIEVSDTVRAYLHERFGISASRLTTEEFFRDDAVRNDARLSDHQDLLAAFLGQCDLAKFSGWRLNAADMEGLYASAHRFVTATAADTANAAGGTPVTGTAPTAASENPPIEVSKDSYVQLPTT